MQHNEQPHHLLDNMKAAFAAKGFLVELPHLSGKTLGTVYTSIEEKSLTASFTFNANFNNPFRRTQGGFICAYFDEVFGPLSFLVAKRPVVTLSLNTTYMRPFDQADEQIIVRAEVVSQSKSILIMDAQAKTKDDKLIAIATSHNMILNDEQLSRKPT
ncbi:MAG: PaaI family thioesterase [Candidatus Berkiella sp.]